VAEATPTSQPAQIPVIPEGLTAKLHHPYESPSNAREAYLHKELVEKGGNAVAYMKAIRLMNDTLWLKSRIGAAVDPLTGLSGRTL
jgi:hypothetical protein|tara:strand:+ start:461 stop:718 length:258 start_codon:yes stop_codon:yes gene_type:complete